jgi:hypothetical protein
MLGLPPLRHTPTLPEPAIVTDFRVSLLRG